MQLAIAILNIYDRERGGAMHFANVKRVQFLEVLRQLTVDGE